MSRPATPPRIRSRRYDARRYLGCPSGDLARLDRAAVRLGGTFDVHTEHTVGLTIPVSAGFGEIERTFEQFCEGREGCEWSLANVFDGDGNPLNWWQGS